MLTKWIEKLIPLRRLTTIVMPHRGTRATLRPNKNSAVVVEDQSSTVSKFSTMSSIQILKYGLAEGLWKKKGWLFQLLQGEGSTDGSKQSRKQLCWQYYKNQLLYIEAMQDAKDDTTFEPRRSDHKTGKDGKFVSAKKRDNEAKKCVDVTYLCFAFDVPYATFKRWKLDAGVTAVVVPFNKGKSVLTNKNWASKLYNARRMFIKHSMALWHEKHPAKKNDAEGNKVRVRRLVRAIPEA